MILKTHSADDRLELSIRPNREAYTLQNSSDTVSTRPDTFELTRLIPLLLLALLFAMILVGCHKQAAQGADEAAAPPPVVAVSTQTVEPTTLQQTISVTGTLAPLAGAEAKVAPVAPGRVRQVLVQNGQHVERGQLIAVMESGPLTGQLEQARAAVGSASAAVRQARAGYGATVAGSSAAVEVARTNVAAAEVALQKLLAGSRPEEVAQAQTAVQSAEAAVQNAQQNRDRQQRLYEAGLVPRKDVEAAQLQLTTAEATLQTARQALQLRRRPNRPQDIAAARIAVQQARDQLGSALAASRQNSVKAGDVSIAEQQLASARGNLASAQAQVTAQYIRAPVSGTVTQRLVNPGEYVDTTGAICIIADLSRVRVLLQTPASKVGSVRAGDPVSFSTGSSSGQVYNARVTLVGNAVDPSTNTVTVEAIAPNSHGRLRDDGFVRATITTGIQSNVLVVPADSVVMVDGKPTVYVVTRDGVAHAHTVTTGPRVGNRVEILDGIQPGNTVVTTGAYELSDGAKVRTAVGRS